MKRYLNEQFKLCCPNQRNDIGLKESISHVIPATDGMIFYLNITATKISPNLTSAKGSLQV